MVHSGGLGTEPTRNGAGINPYCDVGGYWCGLLHPAGKQI